MVNCIKFKKVLKLTGPAVSCATEFGKIYHRRMVALLITRESSQLVLFCFPMTTNSLCLIVSRTKVWLVKHLWNFTMNFELSNEFVVFLYYDDICCSTIFEVWSNQSLVQM